VASHSLGEVRAVDGGFDARLAAAARASIEISAGAAQTQTEQMPLVEIPAKGADTLVVFYSGDGGWRDIDKKISDYLNTQGLAVVGIDSLRYFWREKTPAQIGADLDRLAEDYKKRWGIRHIAMVGYSMGAGILPFAWYNLSEKTRRDTSLVALLGLDPSASFEVSISGYLGLNAASDVAIGPAVRTLPHDKVMCFYGADEGGAQESGCLAPEMRGAALIERPGGHHFDGNYQPIAEMINDRLKQARPTMELASHRYDLPDAM
jgi:type IV secretory pathway VirJ component